MAQTFQGRHVQAATSIDYTPGSAVDAGAVVVQGSLVGVALEPIAANVLGALEIWGIFDIVKANGAITAGAKVYWDSNGDPQGGTAGTGCLTTTATGNTFAGFAAAAAAETAEYVRTALVPTSGAASSYNLENAITDPGNAGAIPVTQTGQVALVTAGAETRTLAAPASAGLLLSIYMKTDGGDCVLTCATTVNEAGNNTITFDNTGESVLLRSVEEGSTYRWRVVNADGAGLSTV